MGPTDPNTTQGLRGKSVKLRGDSSESELKKSQKCRLSHRSCLLSLATPSHSRLLFQASWVLISVWTRERELQSRRLSLSLSVVVCEPFLDTETTEYTVTCKYTNTTGQMTEFVDFLSENKLTHLLQKTHFCNFVNYLYFTYWKT